PTTGSCSSNSFTIVSFRITASTQSAENSLEKPLPAMMYIFKVLMKSTSAVIHFRLTARVESGIDGLSPLLLEIGGTSLPASQLLTRLALFIKELRSNSVLKGLRLSR